jgi:hypothetical protein
MQKQLPTIFRQLGTQSSNSDCRHYSEGAPLRPFLNLKHH